MHRSCWFLLVLVVGLLTPQADGQRQIDKSWATEFAVEKSELSATGRNPYFILEPGYQLRFENTREQLVITVLNEVKIVDGVTTRVVEEREAKDGKPVEVSR